jgi:hypothetical protein
MQHTTKTNANPTLRTLRLTLTILGGLSVFVAANVAFGGLRTLGLQGTSDFVTVRDEAAFLIRDSHAHYYGGVYLALGAFLIYAARDVRRYQQALNVVFATMFAGGVARLTQLEPSVTFGADLITSTVIELIGIPALAMWVHRASHATEPRTRPIADLAAA